MIDHSAEPHQPAAEPSEILDESHHLLNRELSWLQFNLGSWKKLRTSGTPSWNA